MGIKIADIRLHPKISLSQAQASLCLIGCGHVDSTSGLPDFSWYNIPKWEKIYQITIKYTKWTQYTPNGSKIDQMAVK
jgi:protoporphyrinogen oxidase